TPKTPWLSRSGDNPRNLYPRHSDGRLGLDRLDRSRSGPCRQLRAVLPRAASHLNHQYASARLLPERRGSGDDGWGSGAGGDADLEHGAEALVGVVVARGHDALDGAAEHGRRAVPGEDLGRDPLADAHPFDGGDGPGHELERGPGLLRRGGELGADVGAQLL